MSPLLEERAAAPRFSLGWIRMLVLAGGAILIGYLCWRILAPFVTPLSWAFALAILAQPVYRWLSCRIPRPLAALITVILAAAILIVPAFYLARTLVREAADVVNRISREAESGSLRAALENGRWLGPLFGWLDSQVDLPKETVQLARSFAGWASSMLSSVLTASIRVMTQIAVTLFVLFYFLRDGDRMLRTLRQAVPLPSPEVEALFARIALMIRVSLGGKVIVACLQGILGGLMFYWLDLRAPVFWGFAMAILSLFPVVGSFVIWLPAAIMFAIQGDWRHAVILAVWGIAVIHPVDNLLGPVLVGSRLRTHTLLMFFSIIGGLAAFGASGLVLGPVTLAVVTALVELGGRLHSGAEGL